MSTMVVMSPEATQTRVLVTREGRDLLRAALPPVVMAHHRAASTLLEGLALWLDERLGVVLVADERARSSCALPMCDALGFGEQTLHYDVAVHCRADRQRERRSHRDVADFRDLRDVYIVGAAR